MLTEARIKRLRRHVATPPQLLMMPSDGAVAGVHQVLGQQTWELAKERLAQRAQVSVPRMVRSHCQLVSVLQTTCIPPVLWCFQNVASVRVGGGTP